MIHRHRTLLFLFFVLTFFISTGSVLFYTYGYRFSFERGIFIYTGSLSLKTNIDTVSITIDGITIPEKRLGILNNTIQVSGLNPGEHMIEVSASGYKPWARKIVIQSGVTTEFWNIFLTEENYKRTPVIATEQVIKMFPAPNGLFATVKKNDTQYSINILDIGAKENTEVFTTNEAVFLPTQETNIEWSPESHKLIIPLTKNNQPIYTITDIKTKQSHFLNEMTAMTTPISAPRWDATTKNFLFFLNQGNLYRFNTATFAGGSFAPVELVRSGVAAYELSGSKLYYLDATDGLIYETNGHGESDASKRVTPTPVTLNTKSPYSLIVYDETRLAIIEEYAGRLLVFNKSVSPNALRELGNGIKSLQYSDDGKKLLFYTDNEISVYFNQDWPAQPARANDSIVQVARFSAPINNVQWTEDYEHVLFSLGKTIKMIELDNRDRRGLSNLVTLENNPTQMLARFGTDTLYIVSETSPDAPAVFDIILPQYTTLFGL